MWPGRLNAHRTGWGRVRLIRTEGWALLCLGYFLAFSVRCFLNFQYSRFHVNLLGDTISYDLKINIASLN